MANRDIGISSETVEAIVAWTSKIDDYPGFREWKSKSVSLVLDDFRSPQDEKHPTEFAFAPHVERQHAAMMAFLALQTTWNAMRDCEFYLRKHPGKPIEKDAHLRYTIEMYLSRIYEFSERMKKCLNAINATLDGPKLDAGKVIKEYAKAFRQELAARNAVHHNSHFSDLMLDRISVTGLVSHHPEHGRGWATEQRIAYRKTQSDWVARFRRRTDVAKQFLHAIEVAMLAECRWLKQPINPTQSISVMDIAQPG